MNDWQGEKVELKGLALEDASFFYEWNKHTETQRFLDYLWFPSSLIRQEKWVEQAALKTVEDDSYFFVITNLAGERVGMIHTKDCDKRNGHFSYGMGIVNEHRQKGYATEAIQMVLRHYFYELRYHKAQVSIYAFNQPSIQLHQALGFKQEGRLREMIYQDNSFKDVLVFGLLKREFRL